MNVSTHHTGQIPARLLFLCSSEAAVRMDARNLRDAGAHSIAYAVTAEDALGRLEGPQGQAARVPGAPFNGIDLLVCDEQMKDMPASAFLYRLAGTPPLPALPVLVLASSSTSAALYRQAGVATLERPYTPAQLATAVREAISPDRCPLSSEAFEKAGQLGLELIVRERTTKKTATPAQRPLTTTDLYLQGMELLKQQEYASARQIFQQVLRRQENHLEACLGLARTYQIEGNTEGVRDALLRAAAVCMRNNDQSRAAHIISMLPEGMRNNIFAHEALARIRAGEYRAAALSFLEAGQQRPDQPLHSLIARACLMTTKPETYMAKICEALEGLGHKLMATALRRRLLEYPECRGKAGTSGWLDKHPRLKEIVSVASCAALAWKQA